MAHTAPRWNELACVGWQGVSCYERYERAGGTVTWQVGCPLPFRALGWLIPAGSG